MGKVNYEWDVETIDTDSRDILDHDHHDSLFTVKEILQNEQLVLVRDTWEEDGELSNRTHWYPGESQYPMFEDGKFVPKRFFNEYKRWKESR